MSIFHQHPPRRFDLLDPPALLPSSTTSPGEESTAKCSSSVAICNPSGCRITANRLVSGIAPPFAIAIIRAPRRGCRCPCTPSRNRYAPYRPRLDSIPSCSSFSTSSNCVSRQLSDTDTRAATPRYSASSSHGSAPQAATICCISTSIGASGISSRSSSPARIFRISAACSSRSSRVVAKKRPFGIAPRQCPARPTRCIATATARVVLIWHTRSTSPISIPSSSEAVAIRILISPVLQPLLRIQPQPARERPMVRSHVLSAKPLRQLKRNLLHQPPRVDEDQRAAMLLRNRRKLVEDLRSTSRSSQPIPIHPKAPRSRDPDSAAVPPARSRAGFRAGAHPVRKSATSSNGILRRR